MERMSGRGREDYFMTATQETTRGSAPVQGELWSARARDWAEIQEGVCRLLFQAVLAKLAIKPGTSVLDVGCGAGMLCTMAAREKARISGIDAAPAMISIATERVPKGDFRVGEMEELPFGTDTFDVVTAVNAFQYAANPLNALQEACRVVRPGGRIVVATWGKPQDCPAAPYFAALRELLPPRPPGAPDPFALAERGALEAFVQEAGLIASYSKDVDCPWVYPNHETALRGLMSSGPAAEAIQAAGEKRVREAAVAALQPFATPAGAYRLTNRYRFVVGVLRA
jgi:SAM-dependent methyltransferase